MFHALWKWEQGYENIYGVVEERQGISLLRRLNSRLFYKVAGSLSDGAIPENASDFKLVDRKVYEAVRGMTERNRFVRGLFAWVGFKSIGVPMKRPPRFAGVSNASSTKVVELALKGIFAHSYRLLPTKVIFMDANPQVDAETLALDSSKARSTLGWRSVWSQGESVSATIKWWDKVLNQSASALDACDADIDFMLAKVRSLGNS